MRKTRSKQNFMATGWEKRGLNRKKTIYNLREHWPDTRTDDSNISVDPTCTRCNRQWSWIWTHDQRLPMNCVKTLLYIRMCNEKKRDIGPKDDLVINKCTGQWLLSCAVWWRLISLPLSHVDVILIHKDGHFERLCYVQLYILNQCCTYSWLAYVV